MGRKKKRTSTASPDEGADTGLQREKTSAGELTINKDFAERYETAKRKQLLSSVPAAVLDDSSGSESSSEEEDEFAEQLTKGIDRRVRETLEAIRNKDPRIYNKDTKFFDNEVDGDQGDEEEGEDGDESEEISEYDSDKEPVAGWETIADSAKADIAKVTLKDYVRETLLKEGKLSDSEDEDDDPYSRRLTVYDEGDTAQDGEDDEKISPSNGIHRAMEGSGDDVGGDEESDGDNFFKKKEKSAEEIEAEQNDFEKFLHKQAKKTSRKAGEELLLHSYLENEKPDEKERFLRDFVLNNGWLDKNASDAPAAGDYEIEIDQNDPDKTGEEDPEAGDDEFEDKVDEYEAKYNFRFEDPDGTKVVSHARKVPDSMRRPDDRRKRARQARKLRKQQEKLAKTEEIKHLKNLKKKEVKARLLAIQEAAGDGIDVSGIDLNADFDPDKFNRQMERKFGDDYYSQKDEDMKQLTKEGVAVASEKRLPAKASKDVSEDLREDVNKLMDEYYNLDYEDIVGGVPMRFTYKKVEPQAFNMTADEILSLEDKELNRIVSMKYLAPYRANRDIKKQSWRVHDALKKQRQARKTNDASNEGPSALHALAKAKAEEKNHVDANGSLSRGRRKGSDGWKRKRSRNHADDQRDEAESVVVQGEAEDGGGPAFGRGGEEEQRFSKKRKRKKHSKAETVQGLSTSRKEAYNIN